MHWNPEAPKGHLIAEGSGLRVVMRGDGKAITLQKHDSNILGESFWRDVETYYRAEGAIGSDESVTLFLLADALMKSIPRPR